ncbi:MAG: serine hydrolase [Phaeodactylibacter sp.]|nr:serine hydrolase [Phaeodactylibacter sp.]MCB9276906.1 serine hydrolase [Lewinellaceae bacterium]
MKSGIWPAALLVFLFFGCSRKPKETPLQLPGLAPFLKEDVEAVEASIRTMTLEQKLGQFILLSGKGEPDGELYQWVKAGKVGGIQWHGLSLEQFARLRDSLQRLSPQPLFVAAPGGVMLNNAFSDALPLPAWDALMAVPDDTLRHTLSQTLIQQAIALKVNYLPAPYLSRWEQRTEQLDTPLDDYAQLIHQLNRHHILSLMEAFSAIPLVRGDTSVALDSMLEAYRYLAKAGLSGFRVDGALFNTPGLTAPQINRFFREKLQFGGLLAVEMRDPSQLDMILQSGADLIIVPSDPGFVLSYLKSAFRKGGLAERSLNDRLRRILLARRWIGRSEQDTSGSEGEGAKALLPASLAATVEPGDSNAEERGTEDALAAYFQDGRWRYWQRRLYEESLVLAANPDSLLPLRPAPGLQYHVLHLGSGDGQPFDETFSKYASFESHSALFGLKLDDSSAHSLHVVLLHGIALDSATAQVLLKAARRTRLALVNFGRPDNLSLLDTSLVVIQAFSDDELYQSLAAQLLFGGMRACGKLPYTLNGSFRKGQGLELQQSRLRYGIPEQMGIAPEKLVYIDAIIASAISQHAFPGCQVVVAKGGTVIYDKAFGHYFYDTLQPTRLAGLYDIASLTKVAATTLVAMKQYEEEKIGINDKLRSHLDLGKRSGLRNLTIKKLMTHQSGLQPFMPVVPYLLARDEANADCSRYFCNHPNDTFSIQVAHDFYFDHRYWAKIWSDVENLAPHSRRFRYSDVNMDLMQRLLEKEGSAGIDSLASRDFYGPLGLRRTLFNPLSQYPPDEIAPTQNDIRWRHQLIHGYVHDETAALFGGVAGHAGLFSTAEELAVIFQMLLDGGQYGGMQYLQPETVKLFTSARHGNHRGLGFDKPSKETIKNGNFPEQVSEATFGHTGFTGTCAWADPEVGLTYIFLSNRIHPDVNNRKIFEYRVRERIHQAIYDALDTYTPEMPVLAVAD